MADWGDVMGKAEAAARKGEGEHLDHGQLWPTS